MTQKDFFTAVANGNITDEVKAYATERAEKLSAPTPKQVENAALSANIAEFLATQTEPIIGAEIAKHFEVSTSKVTGLCGVMVKNGQLTKSEVATKDGTRIGYSVVK